MTRTYKEISDAFLKLKEEGRFSKDNVEEILDAIAEDAKDGIGKENDAIRAKMRLVGHFHEDLGIYVIPSWEWLRPFAEMLKGKKVLDFGAGTVST